MTKKKQSKKSIKSEPVSDLNKSEINDLIERNVKEFKEFILVIDLPKRFVTTGFLMLNDTRNYIVINTNPWSCLADTKLMMRVHNLVNGVSVKDNGGFVLPDNYKIFELPSSIPPVSLTSSENAGVYLGVFLARTLFVGNGSGADLSMKLFDAVPSFTTLACKTNIYFGTGSSFTNDISFVAYPINGDINRASVLVADIGYESYIIRQNDTKITVPFSRFLLWDSGSKNKARKAIEANYIIHVADSVTTGYYSNLHGSITKLFSDLSSPKLIGNMTRQKFNKLVSEGELKTASPGVIVTLVDGKRKTHKLKVFNDTWVDLPIG